MQAHELDGTCLEEFDGLGNGAGVGGGTHGNAGLDSGAHKAHVLGRSAALGSRAGDDVVGVRRRNGVDGLAEHLRGQLAALDGHAHRKGAVAAVVIVMAAATRVVTAIAIMVVLTGAVIVIAAASALVGVPAGTLIVAVAIVVMAAGTVIVLTVTRALMVMSAGTTSLVVLAGTSLIVTVTAAIVVVTASAGFLVLAVAITLAGAGIPVVALVVGAGGANHAEHGVHGFVELAFDKGGGVGGKAYLAHAHRGEQGALKAQGVAEHAPVRPAQKRGDAHRQALLAKRPGEARCISHPGRKRLMTRTSGLKRLLQRGARTRKGAGEQRDEPGRKLLAQAFQVDFLAFAQARRQTP